MNEWINRRHLFIKNCDLGRIIMLNMEQGRLSFVHLKAKSSTGAENLRGVSVQRNRPFASEKMHTGSMEPKWRHE